MDASSVLHFLSLSQKLVLVKTVIDIRDLQLHREIACGRYEKHGGKEMVPKIVVRRSYLVKMEGFGL